MIFERKLLAWNGKDLEVKAIYQFGTPTGQSNFFSDLSPEGTDVLTDSDGNPISWNTPVKNPFNEEKNRNIIKDKGVESQTYSFFNSLIQ